MRTKLGFTKETVKKVTAATVLAAMSATALVGCAAPSNTITVVSREDGSGTRSAFVELMEIVDADKNDATIDTAEVTNSTSVMISTVAGNKSAIGYISLGSLSDDVKALQLNGVDATVENIKAGTYVLSRPFNIAYDEANLTDLAADFMGYILSSDGQTIINDEGYISVSEEGAYEATDGLEGKIVVAGSTSVAPVMHVLADAYMEINSAVTIEIQETGSSAGITSATEGAADIGMSSRDLKDEEAAVLKCTKIAMDGIAVIANKENAATNITSEQVKGIYTGEITDWTAIK